MKANCLTRALDQWSEAKDDYLLFYNSNHVVSIDYRFNRVSLEEYLPLSGYGYSYFTKSFNLTKKYRYILSEYLTYENKPLRDK